MQKATRKAAVHRACLLLATAALIGCSSGNGGGSKYLYVWAGPNLPPPKEGPRSDDFVAVINADPADSNYGRLITSVDAGFPGIMAHHTEFMLPAGHPLFAGDFMSEQIALIDFTDPVKPRFVRRIDSVPGFETPHSFVRLPNGNVIATLQFGGDSLDEAHPGGIAEFDTTGTLLRTASGADPAFPGAHIRTYGLELLPAIDRAVTTSSPMSGEVTADVIQVWSLSDLKLRKTIKIEGVAGDSVEHHPFEVRTLPGGRTALMNTARCGFYLLTGLESDAPKASLVYEMPAAHRRGCAVPVIVGHYWVMPIATSHVIVVLDIADPAHPVERSVLPTDTTFFPHWSSADPRSDRIVFTGQGNGEPRVLIAHLDQSTGTLSWDARFRDPGGSRPGLSFSQTTWPHGAIPNAMPHGALFGPAMR